MRWSGPFPTPNIAGMELAAAVVVLAVLMVPHWRGGRIRRIAALALGITATVLAVLLICTGSRAGVLAMDVALAAAVIMRSVPLPIAAAIALAVTLGGLASPHAGRFTHPFDTSTAERIGVWRGGLALIADHPLTGVGPGAIPQSVALWYRTDAPTPEVDTFLNDPISIAAAWGLPALAVADALLCLVLLVGMQRARDGQAIAALGVVVLLTHLVAGLFQAHLYAGWWLIRTMWVVGILSAVGGPGVWSPRPLLMAVCAGLCLTWVLYPLGCLAGHADWSTRSIDGMLIASPSDSKPSKLVIAISTSDEPKAHVRLWLSRRRASSEAVALVRCLPTPAWIDAATAAMQVPQRDVEILASGEDAMRLWRRWRQGKTGAFAITISDPTTAPSMAKTTCPLTQLTVRIATLGDGFELSSILREAKADHAILQERRALMTRWWTE